MMRKLIAVITVILPLLAFSSPAAAFNFFELEVYPYQTEGKGVAEAEWLQSFVPKGHSMAEEDVAPTNHLYRSSAEISYGLTQKIEGAFYLDWAHVNGQDFKFAGTRYRLRGSLFEKGQLPIDVGWYAELEWQQKPEFTSNDLEVDLRPILERDLGRFTVSLNPIFEKALAGPDENKGFEFQYAAKIRYRYLPEFSPGLEFYGDMGKIDDSDPLNEQQHYIVPVVDIKLGHGLRVNFGAGFGLTNHSDQVITKLNIEFEWFAGPG